MTLDLAMPGIGGLAFLEELSTKAHSPIVVISSSTKVGSVAETEAIEHGAFGFRQDYALVRRQWLAKTTTKSGEGKVQGT